MQIISNLRAPLDWRILFSKTNGVEDYLSKTEIISNLSSAYPMIIEAYRKRIANLTDKELEKSSLNEEFYQKKLIDCVMNFSDKEVVSCIDLLKIITGFQLNWIREYIQFEKINISLHKHKKFNDPEVRLKLYSGKCAEYAFYGIFKNLPESSEIFSKGLDHFLQTLMRDYFFMPVSDPIENDLIVYFDEKEKPIHCGYCINSQLAESKLNGLILSHAFDFSPYGDSYQFFRSSQA